MLFCFHSCLEAAILVYSGEWMSVVEPERHLGVFKRIKKRASDFLFPLSSFKDCIPHNPEKENFRLTIAKFLQKKGHRVDFVPIGSDRIEIRVDESTSRIKEKIFSSPECAALILAMDYGCPERVRDILKQSSSLPFEIKAKIFQLSSLPPTEKRGEDFHRELDKLQNGVLASIYEGLVGEK